MRKIVKNDPEQAPSWQNQAKRLKLGWIVLHMWQVKIDWIDVPVQKQRGPNGVESRTGSGFCYMCSANHSLIAINQYSHCVQRFLQGVGSLTAGGSPLFCLRTLCPSYLPFQSPRSKNFGTIFQVSTARLQRSALARGITLFGYGEMNVNIGKAVRRWCLLLWEVSWTIESTALKHAIPWASHVLKLDWIACFCLLVVYSIRIIVICFWILAQIRNWKLGFQQSVRFWSLQLALHQPAFRLYYTQNVNIIEI